MFKKFLVIATLAAGLISTQASAAFVSTDWKVAGDKGAVLDTTTGIEWLNLLETKNQSINQVLLRIESGELNGWRLPTYHEIEAVWSLAIQRDVTESRVIYQNISATFPNMLGVSYSTTFGANFAMGYGYYYDGTVKDFGASTISGSLDYWHAWNYSTLDSRGDTRGVFLVSDGGTTLSSINDPTLNINNPNAPINMADVSAPLGLAGAGLLIIMLGGRRKAV